MRLIRLEETEFRKSVAGGWDLNFEVETEDYITTYHAFYRSGKWNFCGVYERNFRKRKTKGYRVAWYQYQTRELNEKIEEMIKDRKIECEKIIKEDDEKQEKIIVLDVEHKHNSYYEITTNMGKQVVNITPAIGEFDCHVNGYSFQYHPDSREGQKTVYLTYSNMWKEMNEQVYKFVRFQLLHEKGVR